VSSVGRERELIRFGERRSSRVGEDDLTALVKDAGIEVYGRFGKGGEPRGGGCWEWVKEDGGGGGSWGGGGRGVGN